jgi:two-component system OmpR family response regulator
MQKNILIVDDDPHIIEVLKFALEKAGFTLEVATNGREALDKASAKSFALIVLDITMPEMDGLETCRRLRKSSEVPVLFLSSRDEEIDRIVGLEIGGDDYVTKPFSPRELVVRVQAILKRTAPKPVGPTSISILQKGALRVDTHRYVAFWHDKQVALTATEFALLAALLEHPGKVYTRDELMDRAYDGVAVSDRTIDSHIRRIRQKFAGESADSIIETLHGIGYTLGPCR